MEVLELCFSKEQSLNAWRSALVAPPKIDSETVTRASRIVAAPTETIEAAEALQTAPNVRLGVKSTVTGRFSRRVSSSLSELLIE